MRLHYSILIFEDDHKWVNNIKKDLARIVSDEGFQIDVNEDILNFDDDRDITDDFYNRFDMILVDYSLCNGKKGNDIIKRIRDKQHYTEVIFYTSGGNADFLREIIASEKIEGVYCAEKDYELLLLFEDVFKNTIKKVFDLNNLRGLVMAETSLLDNKKGTIFKKARDKELIDSTFFEQHYYPKSISRHKKNLIASCKYANKKVNFSPCEKQIYDKFDELKFMQDHHKFDFDTKRECLPELLSHIDLEIDFDKQKYLAEVQRKRNLLAHEPERISEGVTYFGDYEFNRDEAIKILNYISEFNERFDRIIEEIDSI
jgi:ribosomal protein S21